MSLNLKLPELAVNVQEPEPTEQDIEDVLARARIDEQEAKNKDILALTDLKKKLSVQVIWLMWLWFVVLCIAMAIYFGEQFRYSREIPAEVIIAMLTSTTVVVGLVGLILKGLFKVQE
jgi:membrane-associated HD superfamily phosphohydrolase